MGASVIFPKPFQTLYEATFADEAEAPRLIKSFLKTWYPSMGKLGAYWHAFDIRGANTPPFDPLSRDLAERCEVILTVLHECQVRGE